MNVSLGIAVAGALVATLWTPSFAWSAPTDESCWPGMMWSGGWYGMFFGPLIMIVFIAAIVAVVVLVVRRLGGFGQSAAMPSHDAPGKMPLDILKERFARGEIDKEEFEERRHVLDG